MYDAAKLQYQIAHVTGALSMFGSAWILTEILLDRKKIRMTYHRILFGLSFFDFFSSFGFFLGNWVRSKDADDWTISGGFEQYGRGTITTCNITGFLIYLGSITIPLYSASLTMYYNLIVCRQWSEERIKKRFEIYVHMLIPPIGIIIAIYPLMTELYNGWYFYCFVCFTEARGNQSASDILQVLYLITVISSSTVMAYSMLSIICKVTRTFRLSTSYDFPLQRRDKNCCCSNLKIFNRNYDTIDNLWQNNNTLSSMRIRKLQSRGNKVILMALLYLIPFFVTWVFPVFLFLCIQIEWRYNIIIIPKKWTQTHIIQIYVAIFLPLQGFFNWFVFMYRRYQSKKSRYNYNNRCFSFCHALKLIGKVLERALNLRDTEDDGDHLLGSGMEIIDFEDDQSDSNQIQLISTSLPIIFEKKNKEEELQSERNSDESRIIFPQDDINKIRENV